MGLKRIMGSLVALVTVLLACVGPTAAAYTPDWPSLNSRPIPSWFDDAKFGIFIHWGVYSVPAWAPVGTYAEWFWHDMMDPQSPSRAFFNHTYGENTKYQDLAGSFKAEMFNASFWAEIIKASGAQYVVPTSKHHEGFTLWPSAQSWNWNSVDVGPHRDLISELFAAFRAAGLRAGLYYSLYEWFHPLYTGPNPHSYVEQVMLPQLYDLVNNYQPEVIWTDGEWDQPSEFWNSTDFLAWLYNESPVKDTVVVNDRWGKETRGVDGGIFTAEYSDTVWLTHKWEENSGIDTHSYGYNRNTPAADYFTADYCIKLLIRAVANNGNLLLDIGPSSDGRIPEVFQLVLLGMGEWLSLNGEAIYNTRPWRVQQEGSIDNTTVRYTSNNGTVYAIAIAWPEGDTLLLPSPVSSASTSVEMIGFGAVQWKALGSQAGIAVSVPALTPDKLPCQSAWVFKLSGVT